MEAEDEVPLEPGRFCCYCDRKIPDGERAYLVLGDLTCCQCCGPDDKSREGDEAFWKSVDELLQKLEKKVQENERLWEGTRQGHS